MGRRATRIEAGRRYAVTDEYGIRDEGVAVLNEASDGFSVERWLVTRDGCVPHTDRWVEECDDAPSDETSAWQTDALSRIATALERIAFALEWQRDRVRESNQIREHYDVRTGERTRGAS